MIMGKYHNSIAMWDETRNIVGETFCRYRKFQRNEYMAVAEGNAQ